MKDYIRLLTCSIFLQMFSLTAANAALMSNAVLMFDSAVYGTGSEEGLVVGGSFFSWDMNANGNMELWERTGMDPYNGIQLGTVQSASGSHSGIPDGTESPSIDAPWTFNGNTGMHLSETPVNVISSTGNIAYLDMSGWAMIWNGIATLPYGGGSWGSNPEGQAVVTCDVDCSIGDGFSLYYTAAVPHEHWSGIDAPYQLALSGTVTSIASVPLPLSLWLFVSGLLSLIGVARRKAV